MRILVCTQHYEPEHQFGGTVTNAVAIAEGLARRGHQVTVLTSAPGSRNDETTAPSLTQQEWIDSVPKVERLPWEWAIGKARVCRAAPGHLAALVRNQDAVHIIGTYDFISPFITRLAHVYGVPFSMETCGMLPPSGKKLVLKWLFYRLYLQRMLKRAGAILVTSDQEHDDLFGMGFSRAVLIRRRNGVASQVVAGTDTRGQFRTRLGLDDQVPLILWLGRVEPVKQLEVLLLGLSILQNRPYHVAITGPVESESYRSDLADLASRLSLEACVHWVPPVYGDQKVQALHDADVLALVSRRENWGTTVQEALAAGTPVVVTDKCGVAEIVTNKMGLVVSDDPRSVAAALDRLLGDRQLRKNMKAHLNTVAQSMTWDQPLDVMESMLHSLVDRTVTDGQWEHA